MSSPDQHAPWGADPADGPAPPPMMSPYGMPLTGGGPEGPGGYGPDGYGPGGPGPHGPGDPGRRRKTLIASVLAVVAVVGIGAAVVVAVHKPHKHPPTPLAGAAVAGGSVGDGSAVVAIGGGKPDGDDMVGASTNGAVGSNMQGATSPANPGTGPVSSVPGRNPGSTSAPGGAPVTSADPSHPATSAPGGPAPSASASAPAMPKPSTPASTAPAPKPTTAKAPSSDCTYLDLPPAQMPQIKEGSGNVNAVKELQCLLKKSELGIKPLAIDGSWGADTQSAMTAFQSCNNAPTVHSPGGTPPYPKLAVDGVAGPQTWADLYFWDNQYFNGTSYYCNGTR